MFLPGTIAKSSRACKNPIQEPFAAAANEPYAVRIA